MKNKLASFYLFFVQIYVSYWKIKNLKKDKLLIYTDSRGFEVTKFHNRKTPFNSYIGKLVQEYSCEVFICPEKYTTFFDFFELISRKNTNKYKYIICHIGVVDFSPRPQSSIPNILTNKQTKIIDCFDKEIFNSLMSEGCYEISYYGEQTKSLLGANMIKLLADKLNGISNLIWISCNPVDLNWNGNYFRKRPNNINLVNEYSQQLITYLRNASIIDLTSLSLEEVRVLTCDNIHFNSRGMNYIHDLIKKKLK